MENLAFEGVAASEFANSAEGQKLIRTLEAEIVKAQSALENAARNSADARCVATALEVVRIKQLHAALMTAKKRAIRDEDG